ncbi:MAG: ATP-binding cassette domain-containing protein [Chloroflexi bacterium]|nr:ATP-binding cassette domain-containing protein [Chloroflexota bacterium]MQC18399.1 ATP-binding cassette domain-containing protein [Chloroflexota bacterium]
MSGDAPALLVDGLVFRYPDGTDSLQGLSLHVEVGEKVALIGPNGAGKSTLLLNLNGVLRAQGGSVTVFGQRLTPDTEREVRGKVGLLFSNPDDQLFSPTVFDDVAYGPLHMGFPAEEVRRRTEQALAAVGVADFADRPPHRLSLGQKKRVAIATVLSMGTPLLALDEPSANLDPRARRDLISLLDALPLTILVATHDLALVTDLLPRSILLDGGQVIADGPTREILTDATLLEAHGLEPLSAHGHPHA